jgi:hypothetical protein
LAGVSEGELPQQRSDRGGGVHAVEERFHAAAADHVDVIDAVRAHNHARDQGGQLRRRVRRSRLDPRCRDPNLVCEQARQSGLRGQRHHRHQPCARHEVVIVEHR